MRKWLSLLTFVLCFARFSFGQSPQGIPFQAIARDSNGVIIQNTVMSVRTSIHTISPTGTIVYQETQSVTTNNLGIFSLNIGYGLVVSGSFSGINWSSGGAIFVQIEIDPSGGTTYLNMGATQLQTAPYALYSLSSGSIPSGSATGNSLYWNGSSWVSNSNNIFNNGTNIGIGTGSPGYKFDINGSVQLQNASTNSLYVGTTSTGNYSRFFTALGGQAPEIDFLVSNSRHAVCGYDNTLTRSLFYNDNLAAGIYIFDGKGISFGTNPNTYTSNAFLIEQQNSKLYTGSGISFGVGTPTPNSTFADSGSVSFNVSTQTANYTIGPKDHFVVGTTNSFTITLPTAVGIVGREYIIKGGSAGKTITLATTGSQTIDGAAPGTISGVGVIRLVSNGSNWWTW